MSVIVIKDIFDLTTDYPYSHTVTREAESEKFNTFEVKVLHNVRRSVSPYNL